MYRNNRNNNRQLHDVFKKIPPPAKIEQPIIVSEQGGAGIGNIINKIIDKGLNKPSKSNPKYAGEQHGIIKLENGTYSRANYMGPNTNLYRRLKDDIKPLSEVDKISKAHDLRYALAYDENSLRNADKKFIDKLNEVKKNKQDKYINIKQAELIKAKRFAEDINLLKKDAYGSNFVQPTGKERDQYMTSLQAIQQEGYGKKDKITPCDRLKLKALRQIQKDKKSKCGNGMSLAGQGLKLSGNGKKKCKLVASILDLYKHGGMKNDMNKTKKCIKHIENPNKLCQSVLGMIITDVGGMKNINKKKLKQKGNGLINKLLQGFAKYLYSNFKNTHNKNLSKRGNGKKFNWKDFWKGFRSVMKPGLTIGGTALDFMGVPEVGIPLQAIGSVK